MRDFKRGFFDADGYATSYADYTENFVAVKL